MIQAVITDLAGTTIDFGSSAPAGAFIELFRRHGIDLTRKQARAPMGLEKRTHIHTLASMAEIAEQWRALHEGRDWAEKDIDALYAEFIPLQLEILPRFGDLIPGAAKVMSGLQAGGVRIGATTGYNRAMMDVVLDSAARQGFVPDTACCAEDVALGRPAPWMIYRCMEPLGVFPPSHVLNVGDTIPDVTSGRNAGTWSVGVVKTGNMIGLDADEYRSLDPVELEDRARRGREKMQEAGAHYVIDSVEQLPELLDSINKKMALGETP